MESRYESLDERLRYVIESALLESTSAAIVVKQVTNSHVRDFALWLRKEKGLRYDRQLMNWFRYSDRRAPDLLHWVAQGWLTITWTPSGYKLQPTDAAIRLWEQRGREGDAHD